MTVPREEWKWFGSPGHLAISFECRFHLCTKVGPWLVSTVGEWVPDPDDVRDIDAGGLVCGTQFDYKEIRAGCRYETAVFCISDRRCDDPGCNCGMPLIKAWAQVDLAGYNERGDATRGHLAMCERWALRGDPDEGETS